MFSQGILLGIGYCTSTLHFTSILYSNSIPCEGRLLGGALA